MIDKSLIKYVQRGSISETVSDSSFIDIPIKPVNIDKSIVIFNCLNYSSTGTPNGTAIAELVDSETLRIFGNYANNYGILIPKCVWQIIEFN